MSGGGSQTVKQKADPWKGVQPNLEELYGAAGNVMRTPQQYFPYQSYAPMSSQTQAGLQGLQGLAQSYLPSLVNTQGDVISQMLRAPDVANNPYVQEANAASGAMAQRMFEGQQDDINRQLTREWLPQIERGASLAGMTGSTRQGLAQGQAIGDASRGLADYAADVQSSLHNMYKQTNLGAYGIGMQAQQAGAQMLPELAQFAILPAQIQQQVGAAYEAYQQQQIQDAMNRWNFAQNEPRDRLAWANSIYSGVPWNQTQTSTSPGPNRAAGALGGAAAGAAAGSAIYPGVGTAIGALIGGIGGAL